MRNLSLSKYIVFLFLLFLFSNNYAQREGLSPSVKQELEQYDELINKYNREGDKTKEAQFLNKAAFLLWHNQINTEAITYFKRALEISSQMNNRRAIMTINTTLGMIYSDMEEYKNALPYLEDGLMHSKAINDRMSIASGLTNIALALQGLNRHNEAIEKLNEAIAIATELENLKLLRRCYGMVYESYQAIGNSDESYKYFNIYNSIDKKVKRLEMDEVKSQAQTEVDNANLQRAQTEYQLNITTEELRYTEDSLERAKIIAREQEMQLRVNELEKRETEAQLRTQKWIIIFIASVSGLIFIFFIYVYYQFRQKKKANKLLAQQKNEIENYSQKLEETNHELEKLSIVASETDNAVIITDEKGNLEWINNGFTRMFGFSFNQLITERQTNILGENTPQEVRQKVEECLQTKKTVNYEMTVAHRGGNEIFVNTTLTPIIDQNGNIKKLIAIDSDISQIKAAEREICEQRDKLHLQNQEITASIRYAMTIQQAILPDNSDIDKCCENFIIYRPKDIVSGDFYWFSRFPEKNMHFIAAVDCTGHGVPGAFMSMIGNRLLNEIVNEKQIFEPAKILALLNDGVHTALRQEQTDNHDGMDLCLCKIELKNNKYLVTYSGAKRPLFFIKKDSKEVETLKADRRSIGGHGKSDQGIQFTNQTIEINTGDSLFLSSDGIIDQNASNRKRFGTKRLLDLLSENSGLKMSEQKINIEKDLDDFMEGQEQRDDITLLGIKLR